MVDQNKLSEPIENSTWYYHWCKNKQYASSSFIKIDEINCRVEKSLKKTMSPLTGGQRFFSCYS